MFMAVIILCLYTDTYIHTVLILMINNGSLYNNLYFLIRNKHYKLYVCT